MCLSSIEFEAHHVVHRDILVGRRLADKTVVVRRKVDDHLVAKGFDNVDLRADAAAGADGDILGPDAQGRMVIDEASVVFRFDGQRRVLVVDPLSLQAGPVDVVLGAEINWHRRRDRRAAS